MDPRLQVNRWLVAVVVALAAFIEVLDNSIGNVAVPHIAGNLSATMSQSTWVLTSYIVANSVVLPLSGWLSSVCGRRNYFLGSIALFTIASVLCGLAPNLASLVFFRILQGLAGGGLLTVSQAILADTFPPEELGKGLAVYACALVVAPILGPVVGGWITDNYSWRWIFLINLPIGLITVVLVAALIKDPPSFQRKNISGALDFDFIGIALITLCISAFQIVLDRGQELDWLASNLITAGIIIAAVSFVASIIWELRVKDPVVDLRLFKDRNVTVSCILLFVGGIAIYGGSAILPMYVQNMMGYSATLAGLVMTPSGVAAMFALAIIGALSSKGHLGWYAAAGLGVIAYSMYMLENANLGTNFGHMMLSRVFTAVGIAMVIIPCMTGAYATISKTKNDAVSGLTNLARNTGGSVGISVMLLIVDRRMQFHQATLVQHMTPYDPHYVNMMGTTANILTPTTGAANAPEVAQKVLYGLLQQQSALLAYIDSFHFMTVVALIALPLAFFLRSPKHGQGGGMPMH